MADDVAQPTENRPSERPSWTAPGYYGHGEATQTIGSVAAPLLAGFGVAMIGLILTAAPQLLRWPEWAMVALSVSVVLLLACVQFTFRARRRWSTPSEIEQWWPDANEDYRRTRLYQEQAADREVFGQWTRLARWSYDLGIVALLTALSLLLAPAAGSQGANERWVTAGIFAACALAEAVWIATDHLRDTS